MRWLHAALWTLAGTAFVYLVASTGLAPLWEGAQRLGWGAAWIVLLGGVEHALHAAGWRRCFSAGSRPSLPAALSAGLAAHSVNMLTPTATVGGEVVRATLLPEPVSRREAIASLTLDRLTYAATDALLGLAGAAVLLGASAALPGPLRSGLVAAVLAVCLGIGIFYSLQRRGRVVTLLSHSPWVARIAGQRLADQLAGAGSDVDRRIARAHAERPRDLLASGLWHAVANASGALQIAVLLVCVGEPLEMASVLQIFFVVTALDLASFFVPGRLGAQEATRMLAVSLAGYGAEIGLLFSLVQRVEQLAWTAVGFAAYPALIARGGSRPSEDLHSEHLEAR